jgi:hypothetical protein
MSAEALEAEQDKFRKYHTEAGPVDAQAKTTPGVSGLSAAQLRAGPKFLADVAAKIFLMLGELARNRKAIDKLERERPAQTQTPAPLPLSRSEIGQLHADLGELRHDFDTFEADAKPKLQTLGERVVALEHARDQEQAALSPYVAIGVCVACMLISSLGAVAVLLTAIALRWS